MSRASWRIYMALEELAVACETIAEQGCELCPMNIHCIQDTPLAQVSYDCSHNTIREMLKAADEITARPLTQEEWEAEQGNLERCDP